MLRIKKNVDAEVLKKYGFKKAAEWQHFLGDEQKDHLWLISTLQENPEEIAYADDDIEPLWSIEIMDNGFLDIAFVPAFTYRVRGCDIEGFLTVIKTMIEDGVIEDE